MISYRPLLETMKKKEITGYKLIKMGLPKSTYRSIRRGHRMSLNTLNALCEILDCEVTDIIECVKEGKQMISFDPMLKTMKKKGIAGYRLVRMGFSQSTYHTIKRGRGMTLNTLNTLYEILDREVSDLIEYVKEQDNSVTKQE